MKRKIISINEEKCTGCGQCIPDCPEGALQVIEGKAHLISDLFCDGLGACIGTCTEGAIQVIEREAEAYDEKSVMQNIVKHGPAVIAAHLEHLRSHGEKVLYHQAMGFLHEHQITVPDSHVCEGGGNQGHHPYAGCPGAAARSIPRTSGLTTSPAGTLAESELRQWPVQLHLLSPRAPYFDDADILVAADCVPFAYADFHRELLKGKILIIFCPKLDADIDGYIEKMATIFGSHSILSVTIAHMEVPCCSGVTQVVKQAMKKSGRNIPIHESIITIEGKIQ